MSSIVERVRLHQQKSEAWEAEKAALQEQLSILIGQKAAIDLCRSDMENHIKQMQRQLGLPVQIALPTVAPEEPAASAAPKEPAPAEPQESTQPEETPASDAGQATVKRKGKRITKKKLATVVVAASDQAPFAYKPRHNLVLHLDCVRAICFYSNQPALVTASDDGTMKVVNLEGKAASGAGKKRKVHTVAVTVSSLRGHAAPVLCMTAFEKDGEQMMVSGALDGTVAVWTLPIPNGSLYDVHGLCIHHRVSEYALHKDAVWGIDVLRDLSGAVSCSADGTAQLWVMATGEATPLAVDGKPIACKSLKDKQFAVGTETGAVHIFDGTNQTAKIDTKCAVLRMTATEDGARIVVGSDDNCVRVIDVASGEITNEFEAHERGVTGLCITSDGEFLITVGNDENVNAWRMGTFDKVDGEHMHSSKFGEGGLCLAATTSKCTKSYFASGGAEGSIQVFMKA